MIDNFRLYLLFVFCICCWQTQGLPSVQNHDKIETPYLGPYAPAYPYVNDTRQGGFIEWITSIFFPTTAPPTTTTFAPVPTTTQRPCEQCECGNVNVYRRIVGGVETEVREYPWMALLMLNGKFYCGASLISDLYVLTAAHCLRGISPQRITVRLLEYNMKNSSTDVIDRQVGAVFIHEKYSSRTYDSDIAVIRFTDPIVFTDILRPVCMPEEDEDFAGETAVVTGWGAVSEGGPTSNILLEVEVPVLSDEECRDSSYGNDRITENMLCAGFKEGGKDSCQGDSGGPLMVTLDGRSDKAYQQCGVVSWGDGCARPDTPGVYTRVNKFNDWIKQRTLDGCSCSRPDLESTEATN